MSLPRPILRNTTYLVTRRCAQRQFLLLPTAIAKQVFGYCLALAQKDTGVLVHAVMVLSNHYHLVVTDPKARLPHFCYVLNKYVAKCMNAHYGRWENFWAGGTQTSYVTLANDEDKVAKFAYTVANPVEAGLVSRSENWPGFSLWHPGRYKMKRPEVFFQASGPMPESLLLEIAPLPLVKTHRQREVMELLRLAVSEREEALRKEFRDAGKAFLGANRVLRQHHKDSPAHHEPRRALSPRVAARDKWRRIEILQRLRSFVSEHGAALARWLGGARDTCFPAGTYKLRVEFGVTCAKSAET